MNTIVINLQIRTKSAQDKKIVSRGRFKKLIKSEKSLDFERQVEILLVPYLRQMKEFRESFNPKEHALYAEWVFCFDDFYTKKGSINSKCVDIDNSVKAPQDLIVNSGIGVDDHFITRAHIERKQGPDSIQLTLKIINK